MTRHASDLLLFLFAGLLIGLLMRQRETDTNTPPSRGGKVSKVWDTKDLSRFRLQKVK